MAALAETGWQLTQIWNTHHRYDHRNEIKPPPAAPLPARKPIKCRSDRAVDEDDVVMLGNIKPALLNVGGHTLGHIAYMDGHAFVGDSLCAGLWTGFEGTMAQMWTMQKLNALLDKARKYTVRMNIPLPMRPCRDH